MGGGGNPKNFFKVLSSLLNLLLTEQLLVQVWLLILVMNGPFCLLKFQYNIFFNNNLYLLKLWHICFPSNAAAIQHSTKLHFKMWYLWQWVYQPACSSDAEPDVSLGVHNVQPYELLGNFFLPPQQQAAPQHFPATVLFWLECWERELRFAFFRIKFKSPFSSFT